jgi:hypothetical protein
VPSVLLHPICPVLHHPAYPYSTDDELWLLLCLICQVADAPRFIWRGVLLDVGRHFFSVPFILKLLDLMALYKMNRFHWHLTEDQVSLCMCIAIYVWNCMV